MSENNQETKLLPKAQGILHDCLRILKHHGLNQFTVGAATITNFSAISAHRQIEIKLADSIVFKIHASQTNVKIISFPGTRFVTPNTYG